MTWMSSSGTAVAWITITARLIHRFLFPFSFSIFFSSYRILFALQPACSPPPYGAFHKPSDHPLIGVSEGLKTASKTHLEVRSSLQVFRSFWRVFTCLIFMFHILAVYAWLEEKRDRQLADNPELKELPIFDPADDFALHRMLQFLCVQTTSTPTELLLFAYALIVLCSSVITLCGLNVFKEVLDVWTSYTMVKNEIELLLGYIVRIVVKTMWFNFLTVYYMRFVCCSWSFLSSVLSLFFVDLCSALATFDSGDYRVIYPGLTASWSGFLVLASIYVIPSLLSILMQCWPPLQDALFGSYIPCITPFLHFWSPISR